MAATARVTAVKRASIIVVFLLNKTWTIKTTQTIARIPMVIVFPILSMFFSSGVFSFKLDESVFAIFPSSVDLPTATTIPFAVPEVTEVPEKHMFDWFERGVFFDEIKLLFFWTGLLSPVSELSLQAKLLHEMMRMSAGIWFPVLSKMMSPTTRFEMGINSSLPSLKTLAFGFVESISFSRAFSAFCDCKTPTNALIMTMAKIKTPSNKFS